MVVSCECVTENQTGLCDLSRDENDLEKVGFIKFHFEISEDGSAHTFENQLVFLGIFTYSVAHSKDSSKQIYQRELSGFSQGHLAVFPKSKQSGLVLEKSRENQ